MKCNFCGETIPDDSRFCQCCGRRLPAPAAPEPPMPPEKPEDERPAPPPMPPRKKKGGALKWTLIALAIVLILCLGGLNVWQYISHESAMEASEQRIADLGRQVVSKDSELNSLNEAMEALQEEFDEQSADAADLRVKADYLDAIEDFLDMYGGGGYYSQQFHADRGIIIAGLYDYVDMTLVTDYEDGATVSFTTDGSSAEMEFSEDSWSGASTTMYIYPQEPGITYFTFSTEEHSGTFTVMVIVL